MRILLITGIVIGPFLMYYLSNTWKNIRFLFHIVAIISTMVFGIIASLSIYQIIIDNTVLMTNIHAIFLNPFFLLSGSYIGLYMLYFLLTLTMKQ
ncbi:transposase [Ornithinibacillus sp. BX22]|uniref:Transposase n=2 Tax=Ornithinibacillus TaxID=484508 RepID=A0A923L8S9_9BACI|nr:MULTISPECIES: transposase [Ornithinibacillus]MBC5638673.1 transposase [Ornithinibacillus hominis]MBS3680458.1 transposase [Ornithinibacillus massiliensis]